MKKHFNPFDEKHRDVRKRRTKAVVLAERKLKQDRLDAAVKKVLDRMGENWDITYLHSGSLLEDATQHYDDYDVLKANMRKVLYRLGYEIMANENAADGRWRLYQKHVIVYKKKGAKNLNYEELRKVLF